jgi:hypothetical protein
MAFGDPRRDLLDLPAVGDVADLVLAADLLGEGAEPILAAGEQDAQPTAACEPARELGPEAGRCSRDHRDALHALRKLADGDGIDSRVVPTFEGKRGLVLGVANKRSIAWAIARRLAEGGAQLAFTYQGERIEQGVRDLAATVDSPLVTACDVRSDDEIARVFGEVAETFGGKLDLLVHSVAFAAAEDLEGRFTDTPRDRFWMAVDVSAYSLVACARAAEPLMEAAGGGSILTMTYLGGERAVPHYNVMGVA